VTYREVRAEAKYRRDYVRDAMALRVEDEFPRIRRWELLQIERLKVKARLVRQGYPSRECARPHIHNHACASAWERSGWVMFGRKADGR
jgi:hypothetical protein